HHDHEPAIMILPLVVLAIGAIFAGLLNWPEERGLAAFLGESPSIQKAFGYATSMHGPMDPAGFGQMALSAAEEASVRAATHQLHLAMMFVSALVAALGIYFAYLLPLEYREND